MDRTGHRDVKSLHAYQKETGREHEAVSDLLQGSKSMFTRGAGPKWIRPYPGTDHFCSHGNRNGAKTRPAVLEVQLSDLIGNGLTVWLVGPV